MCNIHIPTLEIMGQINPNISVLSPNSWWYDIMAAELVSILLLLWIRHKREFSKNCQKTNKVVNETNDWFFSSLNLHLKWPLKNQPLSISLVFSIHLSTFAARWKWNENRKQIKSIKSDKLKCKSVQSLAKYRHFSHPTNWRPGQWQAIECPNINLNFGWNILDITSFKYWVLPS